MVLDVAMVVLVVLEVPMVVVVVEVMGVVVAVVSVIISEVLDVVGCLVIRMLGKINVLPVEGGVEGIISGS